jgi:hypothetical protein
MKRLLVLALAVTGVLAAGCFVRFGTFIEDTNHFVGLASNLTNVDVVAASVQVDFLSSSGTIVDTENVSPCTRTLQKQMNSPVEATAPSSINARTTKETVRPLTFGHKTVADLDVDEHTIAITTSADEKTTDITGTIHANEDLENVHVCAALFDNDGNVIAVGRDFSTTPGDIDDNHTGTFDVSVDTSDIDVGDIDQYELWFDAIAHNDVTAPVVVGPNDVSEAVHNSGELSPTASVAAGDFTTPDNAFSNNNVYATVSDVDGTTKSEVYRDYNIDDEVPDDSDIDGIAVRVDWFLDAVGTSGQIKVELSWDGGTTWTSAKSNADRSTDVAHTVTLGGSSDKWGHNWDTDELTNANFRVRITAQTSAGDIRDFSFDWIPVTVYYTEN